MQLYLMELKFQIKSIFCHSVYSCIREYDIEARLNPFIVSIIERISIKGIRIRL